MTTRAACFSVMRIVAPGQRRVHQKTHETLALASASAWLSLSMRRVSGVVLIFFTSLCGRPPHNSTAAFIAFQQIFLFIENRERVTFQCKHAGSEPVANFHLQSPGRSTMVHKLNINRNKKSKSRENHCANNAMANWAKIAQTRLLKWPYANVRLVCAARSLRIHAEQRHDNEAGTAGVNKKRHWLKTAKRKSFFFFFSNPKSKLNLPLGFFMKS